MTFVTTALPYPAARRGDQLDAYHGTRVADPYRWLEDPASSDTIAWIAAQRSVTERYLAQLPHREALRRRFEALLSYPRRYRITRVGSGLLYMWNAGLEPHLVLCIQHGWQSEAKVLVDPREFAADGTVQLGAFASSPDGRYIAYSLARRGSEWCELRIRDPRSGRDLADHLRWVKGPLIAWSRSGFYYTRYPEPAKNGGTPSSPHLHHQVWYHELGAAQKEDALVYNDPKHPGQMHGVTATANDDLTLLTTAGCGSKRVCTTLQLIDRRSGGHALRPFLASVEAEFRFVGLDEGDAVLFLTNLHAPNWRLIRVKAGRPDAMQWDEVACEQPWPLEQVKRVGSRYIAVYRRDATHQLCELDETGTIIREIQLPEPGSVYLAEGEHSDDKVLWTHTAFTRPPTVYAYDLRRQHLEQLWPSSLPFNPEDFTTKRVTYPSVDGTRIPMFLVHRASVTPGVERPVLVYGYGGNGISVGPAFDPLLVALLERGVTLAVPCLRGGGEFGDAWHQAGVRERKQTVFEDCIAAVEWLHAYGYSRPERTVLFGDSNGGLLAGALLTQRPDLFAAVVPAYGLLDMLRYQHFTIGHAWIAEYGASDDPEMFPYLLAYSPLHRIRAGVRYPATLTLTSAQDERVVPAHSYKFIATLQAMGAGAGPYLIRIDVDTGHAAHSLPKELAERADVYAFLLTHIADARMEGTSGAS